MTSMCAMCVRERKSPDIHLTSCTRFAKKNYWAIIFLATLLFKKKSIEKLRDVVDLQLVKFGAKIKHYHADGAEEHISKQVLTVLKREGATCS